MKVILVTGVSRGIGRAIVDLLFKYEDNVKVLGISRSKEKLGELKSMYGLAFDYIVGDICDNDNIDKLVEKAIQRYNRIDSIIINAGTLEPIQDVNHINILEWKKLFDTNFFSSVYLVHKTLPYLKESKGNLIFVSSGASIKPYYGWGAYGASKVSINHFSQTIAAEEPCVRSISVAPGVVDTQMQTDIREKFGPKYMTTESLKRFIDLKSNNELLDPTIPASIYANLALKGIDKKINGKYLRYNDDLLAKYL